MKKVLLKIATTIAILAMVGCANSPHCTPELALDGHLDAGPVGVRAGAGVHTTDGACVPQGAQVRPQRQPGEVTARIMSSLEVAAAPIASKGVKQKRMDCGIQESNGQGGYFCDSAIHVESTEVFNQPIDPRGRRD